MINSKENYEHAGRKAGEARKYQLWSEYYHNKDWFNRMIALESKEDKTIAQSIFDDAFKKASYRPSQPF